MSDVNHNVKAQESKDETSSTPGIEPGMDYIWGSDQDDLVENLEKKEDKKEKEE